jgi:aromatic-amino-acid transaminase
MNVTQPIPAFDQLPMVPSDPILGVTEAFLKDANPRKVNLGQGLYYSEDGTIPLLECIREAESQYVKKAPARGYLPSDGLRGYDEAVQELVFGRSDARIVTLQTVGGTGALRVGADLLRRVGPAARVWISEPSWENHRQLFEAAAFPVSAYAYYEPGSRGLDFSGMRRSLEGARRGDVVVLHGCCHNPTGVDLEREQWEEIAALVRVRGLIPFIDLAYQGFGEGIEADAVAPRLFARALSPVLVASSYSKSFSLYGERVGALSIVTANADEAARVLAHAKQVIRTNYSNPPSHGAKLIAAVLASPGLRARWEKELQDMRERIKSMRAALVRHIRARLPNADVDFVLKQRGMFSYSGLSRDQVRRLRVEYAIYLIDSGRICIPALNNRNVEYVGGAIAKVMS